MHNESHINLRNNHKRPDSNGNFPVNNVKGVETIMEEVDRKYGVRRDVSPKVSTSSQVILRPVSGKSNSNRYGEGSRGGESRSKDRRATPQEE